MMKHVIPPAIPTYEDMLAAHERIKPYINRTPVMTSAYLDELSGAQLFFKCENFQEPGAFKVRGATNAVFGLNDEQAAKGVATHSSGNHASCLSYAASRRGIPCNVVMPRTAPQAKKDTVRRYGGKITECEPSTTSREATLRKFKRKQVVTLCIPIMIRASLLVRAHAPKSLWSKPMALIWWSHPLAAAV